MSRYRVEYKPQGVLRRDVDLEVTTTPAPEEGAGVGDGDATLCTPAWSLVWIDVPDSLSGLTGTTLSEDRTIAYASFNGFDEPLGPYGWLAQLEGERCCCVPEWTITWDGGVYAPVTLQGLDAVAVVAGLQSGTSWPEYLSAGTLTISVTCGEITQSVTLVITGDGGGGY